MATNQPHQMMLGLFVLLLVDIIWVASSELSEYIFKDIGFDKPFFSTYTKTSLFSIYLIGFLVWPPWRHQCCNAGTRYARLGRDGGNSSNSSSEGDNEAAAAAPSDSDRDLGSEEEGENTRLSSPQFEPVKMADTDKSSDGEGDDSTSSKSVRFNRVAEVRQMPESDGVEALLSRLSFSASLRAQQELYNLQAALPVRRVASLALAFCILWFMGNYSYQMALSLSHSGIINVVSSTSGLFTLILAGLFPSGPTDSFTLSKLVTVLAMLAGVAMVSMEDMHQHEKQTLFQASPSAAVRQQLLQQPLYHHTHHQALPLPPQNPTTLNNVFLPTPTIASKISSSKANVRVHRALNGAGVPPGDGNKPGDVFDATNEDLFRGLESTRDSKLKGATHDGTRLKGSSSFLRTDTSNVPNSARVGRDRRRRTKGVDDTDYSTSSAKFYDDNVATYPDDNDEGGVLPNKYDQSLDEGTDDQFITSYDAENEEGLLGGGSSITGGAKNQTGSSAFDVAYGDEDTGRLYPNSDPASDDGIDGDRVTSYSSVGDVGSTLSSSSEVISAKDNSKKKLTSVLDVGKDSSKNSSHDTGSRKKSGVVVPAGGRRHQNVRDETFSAAAAANDSNVTAGSVASDTTPSSRGRQTEQPGNEDIHSRVKAASTLENSSHVGNSSSLRPAAAVKTNGSDNASTKSATRSVASAGVSWALCGAVLYACYMVFLRRRVGEHQHIDIPMFFGFVGVFNAVLLWPGLVLLHASGWEVFTWPTARQMIYITANGLVGTVLSELLWLWGCFLTSSLVATLSLSLTIPLSMATDVLLRGVRYSWLFYAGSVPIVAAFVVVTVLTHYNNWDPLGDLCCPGRDTGGHHYSSVSEDLESESLIVSQDDDDDDEEHFSASSVLEHPSSVATTIANTVANSTLSPVGQGGGVADAASRRPDTESHLQQHDSTNPGGVAVAQVRGGSQKYPNGATGNETKQEERNERNNVMKEEEEPLTKDLIDMEGEAFGLKKKRACDQEFKDEALQALIGAESGGRLLHQSQTLVQQHQASGQNDVNKFLPHATPGVVGNRDVVGETYMNIPVNADGSGGGAYMAATTLYGGGDHTSGWLRETSLNRLQMVQAGMSAAHNFNNSAGASSLGGSEMKITNTSSSSAAAVGGGGRGSELFQLQQLQSSPGGTKVSQRDSASSLKQNKNEYNASTKQQTVAASTNSLGGDSDTLAATVSSSSINSYQEGQGRAGRDVITTSASSINERYQQHRHPQSVLMAGVSNNTNQSSYSSKNNIINNNSSGDTLEEISTSGDSGLSSSVPNSSFSSVTSDSQLPSSIDTHLISQSSSLTPSASTISNNLNYQGDSNNHNISDSSSSSVSSSTSNNSSNFNHQNNHHNPPTRHAKDTWLTDSNSSYYAHHHGGYGSSNASAGIQPSYRDARYRRIEGGRGGRLHLGSREVPEDEEDETLEIIRHEDNEIITSQFIATNQV